MLNKLAALVLIAGTCSVISAKADDFAPVKCGTNQERVWVYDSLTTFDVHAQIRCNENVQIVSRVKGYVKVRIKDGSEGYVTDSSLPNLPPFDDGADKPANVAVSTDSLGAIARRLAANSATAASRPAEASNVIPNPADSHTIATSAVVTSAPSHSAPASANVAATPAVVKPSAAPPTPVVVASVPSVPVSPAPKVAAAVSAPRAMPRTVAADVRVAVPSTAVSVATATNPVPAVAPKTEAAVTSLAAPRPTPVQDVAMDTAPAASIVHAKPVYPASSRAVAASAKTRTNSNVQPPAINASPVPPASTPVPAMPKLAPPATTETVANVPAKSPSRNAPEMRKVSAIADSEDFTDYQPVSESADPACQSYFSAYGLAPSQIKWMEQSRKKEFPSVCPAPDPSKVDFVMIFTHDFAGYSSTLPSPVHTDRSGFSDFSATVGVDTAALSNDDADKAHRQFVWVFNMKRGTFDPAAFSPRRRYQFMKVEGGSKAGVKTIEDAFEFFAQQASSR